MNKRLKAFFTKLWEWGNRDVTVQVLGIRQTRDGSNLQTYPIKLEGIVCGEETSEVILQSGCHRITNHASWYRAVTGKDNFEGCTLRKQLVKAEEGYAILITNAPLEVKQ